MIYPWESWERGIIKVPPRNREWIDLIFFSHVLYFFLGSIGVALFSIGFYGFLTSKSPDPEDWDILKYTKLFIRKWWKWFLNSSLVCFSVTFFFIYIEGAFPTWKRVFEVYDACISTEYRYTSKDNVGKRRPVFVFFSALFFVLVFIYLG